MAEGGRSSPLGRVRLSFRFQTSRMAGSTIIQNSTIILRRMFLKQNTSAKETSFSSDQAEVSTTSAAMPVSPHLPNGAVAFASFTFKAAPRRGKIDGKFLYYLVNSGMVQFHAFCKRAADGKFNFQLRDLCFRDCESLSPHSPSRRRSCTSFRRCSGPSKRRSGSFRPPPS